MILDYEWKDLQRVISQSQELYELFDDGAVYRKSPADAYWEWPTGETLYFRHAKDEDQYRGFHGQEFTYIGWNELTKWKDDQLYLKLMSVNRTGFVPERDTPKDSNGNYLTADGKPLPDIPLEVFSTTNPDGPGHGWVKERFIDAAPNGQVLRKTFKNIYNPRTKKREDIVKTQVAIFGTYHENPNLPADYIASLEDLCKNNEKLKRAWLYGDWNITTGGAFDDLWEEKVHVIPRMQIPVGWHIDRSFDWGSRDPFAVGWWAVATGEELTLPDGGKFVPARGSLIQIDEWYGATSLVEDKGLKMSANEVALGILARERVLIEGEWVGDKIMPGPADRNISNVIERESESISTKMAHAGVRWTKSDQSPGSRENGKEMIRDRMQAAIEGERPAIYFMDNCRASIAQIPTLSLSKKKDDVHEDAIDHVYDMVRYRVLKGSSLPCKDLKVGFVY